MAAVRATGRTLFGDNCAVCHGRDAKGGTGFPNLTTSSWLWGGSPEAIAETIRVGINSPHPDTPDLADAGLRPRRRAEARRDGERRRLRAEPVESGAGKAPADKVAAGKAVFTANCAACHGPEAKGNPEVGAPNLTDRYWIARQRRERALLPVSGAACRARCRAGKAGCRRSSARSSRSISSTSAARP